jgi:hypothetical protein
MPLRTEEHFRPVSLRSNPYGPFLGFINGTRLFLAPDNFSVERLQLDNIPLYAVIRVDLNLDWSGATCPPMKITEISNVLGRSMLL